MKNSTLYLPISRWTPADRPREKLLSIGVNHLTDVEIIAILLGSGSREQSAVDLARKILSVVDNDLHKLSRLGVKELMQHKGVGVAKAISIVAALELGRRKIMKSPEKRNSITCSRDAYDIIGPQIMDHPHEEFWILLMNRGMHLIKKINIGKGGVSGVIADKRIIFKHAVEHLASAMILVHNHPSGRCIPSNQDDLLTRSLVDAGKLLDIKIADHIIVGGNSYYSYLDEGRI